MHRRQPVRHLAPLPIKPKPPELFREAVLDVLEEEEAKAVWKKWRELEPEWKKYLHLLTRAVTRLVSTPDPLSALIVQYVDDTQCYAWCAWNGPDKQTSLLCHGSISLVALLQVLRPRCVMRFSILDLDCLRHLETPVSLLPFNFYDWMFDRKYRNSEFCYTDLVLKTYQAGLPWPPFGLEGAFCPFVYQLPPKLHTHCFMFRKCEPDDMCGFFFPHSMVTKEVMTLFAFHCQPLINPLTRAERSGVVLWCEKDATCNILWSMAETDPRSGFLLQILRKHPRHLLEQVVSSTWSLPIFNLLTSHIDTTYDVCLKKGEYQ